MPEPTTTQSPEPQARPALRRRLKRTVAVLLLGAVAGAIVLSQSQPDGARHEQNDASVAPAGPADGEPSREPELTDQELQKLLRGTWRRENDGENILTLNADGTGTLVYKPTGKNYVGLGFTSRLDIEIEWSVEEGYVDFHSVRGEPARAFALASTYEGKHKHRRVAEIDEEHMVLINETQKDDGPRSEWFRVE